MPSDWLEDEVEEVLELHLPLSELDGAVDLFEGFFCLTAAFGLVTEEFREARDLGVSIRHGLVVVLEPFPDPF